MNVHIVERLAFFGVTADTVAVLRRFKPVLEHHIDGVCGRFFGAMAAHSELAPLLARPGTSESVHRALRHHCANRLCAGVFDDDYVRSAMRMGWAHQKIGLHPTHYLEGYILIKQQLMHVASRAYAPRWYDWVRGVAARKQAELVAVLSAIERVMLLDMSVAVDGYVSEIRDISPVLVERISGAPRVSTDELSVFGAAINMKAVAAAMRTGTQQSFRHISSVARLSGISSENVHDIQAASNRILSLCAEIVRRVNVAEDRSRGAVDAVSDGDTGLKLLLVTLREECRVVADLVKEGMVHVNALGLNAAIVVSRMNEANHELVVAISEMRPLAEHTVRVSARIAHYMS